MGALLDSLLDPGAQPTVPEVPSPGVPETPSLVEGLLTSGFGSQESSGITPFLKDLITGGERTTERTQAATPILDRPTGNVFQDARMAVGFLAALSPQAQTNLVKKIIPDAEVSQDDFGTTFFKIPGEEGEFILNRPGMSPQDALQATAQVLAFAPAAGIRFFASGISNFFARGALGGATSLSIDQLAESLGAEGSTEPVGAGLRAGIAAFFEAAAPPVAKGLSRAGRAVLRRKAPPAGATVETGQFAREAQAAEAATGVELFPAQRTGLPREVMLQSFLAELTGGSQLAARALEKQNRQASTAIQRFFSTIADPAAVETGEVRLRSAAQKSIEIKKNLRSERSSPLYTQAFAEAEGTGLVVDTRSVTSMADDFLSGAPETRRSEIFSNISNVKELLEKSGTDLKKLHTAKIDIGTMLNKDIGGETRRMLTQIQTELVNVLRDSSSSYSRGMDRFIEFSPGVDAIKNSIIGTIAGVKDPQLKSIAGKLFDPAVTNPLMVANAKRVIQEVDPQAWNEILRIEFEKRLGRIKFSREEIEQGLTENIPGQTRTALFGNEKSRAVVLRALEPDQRAGALYLEKVLRQASKGRPGGSATAGRQEMLREISGDIMVVRRFLSSPGETLASIGQEEILQRKINALAKIMYDPSYTKDLQAIARMKDPNKRGLQLGFLLNAAVAAGARATPELINGQ